MAEVLAPPMLAAAAVATRLGISKRAVYELAAGGRLPSFRPTGGRAVRFKPEDVEAYLTSCRSTSEGLAFHLFTTG